MKNTQVTLPSTITGTPLKTDPWFEPDLSPSWHQHSLDVRFEDDLEIVYCTRCGREW